MKRFAFILMMTFTSVALSDVKYCPEVIMSGKKIKFSDTELQLFCGDPKSHAWKNLPPYQAELVLRGLLQSRGYLSPEFEVKDNILQFKKGRKSSVKSIKVISENTDLAKKVQKDVKRLYRRRILTTGILNSIEGEGSAQLRKRGYPCGKVSSQVDVTSDNVTMIMEPKGKHLFGEIKREPVPGLHPNALSRFYPMKSSQRFNGDLLTLTEKRLLRSEVLQGTYFLENCDDEGKTFSLEQRFITGPPRTIRFGAGASTESGPMARLRWSNNRSGEMANLLSATLQASLREQSVNFISDYFPWQSKPRKSIFSQVEVRRDSQIKYEQFITRLSPQLKWTKDIHSHGTTWMTGPAYETGTFHSQDKSQTRTFSSAILEGSFQRTAHEYELFDFHPQEGDQQSVSLSYRSPAMGFAQSLTRLDSSMVRLGRITNSGRGSFIGGVRLKAGTAFVRNTVDLASLPPEVKFFGGGSDDLRGFLLRTLPDNDGAGALSRFISKFELRQTHFFHEKVEAFIFSDAGYFSEKSFSLDSRLWYSPGVGLRWLSPIGVVQAYYSRALATSPAKNFGNFYFAGLGGTF